MSALTIPDMWKIVEHHGLVPVPVDLDPRTLAPTPERWIAASSPRTRAALFAHLFGARVPLEPLSEVARARGWILFEDLRQSWTGDEDRGSPLADVSMFSYGPIKTATALAGGVLVVRDAAILARMRAGQAAYPVQSRRKYFTRILKYAGLVTLTKRPLYGAFVRWCRATGKDHDQVIQGSVRGFAGGDFFEKIRPPPRRAAASRCSRADSRAATAGASTAASRARTLLDRRLIPRVQGRSAVPARGARLPQPLGAHRARRRAGRPSSPELRASGFDATRARACRSCPGSGRAPRPRASRGAADLAGPSTSRATRRCPSAGRPMGARLARADRSGPRRSLADVV
jgi:dTDP-4-amino-4,6-dideoxygalactose transaminase